MDAERKSQFDYLLNAFEAASQANQPADHEYAAKRKALFAYVRGLEPAALATAADAGVREAAQMVLNAASVGNGQIVCPPAFLQPLRALQRALLSGKPQVADERVRERFDAWWSGWKNSDNGRCKQTALDAWFAALSAKPQAEPKKLPSIQKVIDRLKEVREVLAGHAEHTNRWRAVNDAIELLSAPKLKPQTEGWRDIEVEKPALPEVGQRILVFDRKYGVCLDTFDTWREQPAGPLVGGSLECGSWFTENDDVTHWMPLPPPPSKNNGDEK